MRNPFFTIAIPTYEMYGKGVEFLDFSLKRLKEQTFQNFEVVVSDHSKNDEIKNLCSEWSNNLNINYHKKDYLIDNPSSNVNNLIKNSVGDYIKFIFQDDFLFKKESLEEIFDVLSKNSVEWLVTSSEHSRDGKTFFRTFHPHWNDSIFLGQNTFSSPSVLTIKNRTDVELFDENLNWLMDVDYYYRMFLRFGLPYFLHNVNVVNRIWGSRLSDVLSDENKNNDLNKIKLKFNK